MDDDAEGYETIELDQGQWVTIEYSRRWPRYIAEWSVRQEISAESNFPLASGTVERMPPTGDKTLDDVRAELREDSVSAANAALSRAQPPQEEKRGLLSRLFGR